ncbi:OmpA family protein [Sphingomonas profundi]|uniref:OmpA family protein n=1 Tax=Alterirhizorhabdus profundi TaxID=2681549 RepID=UPI0018D009E9|nr:OmpA family protein [Sphingomonas profundi]
MIAGLSATLLAATFLAATAAPAQTAAEQKEEVVCQLLDTCGSETAAPPQASPSPRGAPRTTSTRGFSLARPKADTAAAAAAAPVANRPTATKQSYASSKPKPAAAGKAGAYDLRVTFKSGSAELAPSAKSRAQMFASALQDPRLAGRRVRIEGHTDSIGNADKNKDLSERRARAVADLLTASGVESGRLDVAGYGPSEPLAGLPSTAPAQRRVVAVLVK